MITTYSGLLTEIMRLIDGEDISGSEIPVNTLSQIVHLGERRIYRELRTRYNEKSFSAVTVSGNLAAIPSDFEATSLIHFGKKPLTPKPENWLISYLDDGNSGECSYYCNAGPNFRFAPAVSDGTAVQGRYYYRLPDLDDDTLSTNTVFAVAEDLFIYAALSKSAPFFGQDARIPVWDAQYGTILEGLNLADHRSAYSSGRIARGASSGAVR